MAVRLAIVALLGALLGGGLVALYLRRVGAARGGELAHLEQLVKRRAEQVTALSHELRTPLSMIKGAVDLLREGTPGPLTPAQERFLQVVDHQCTQVIGLCESLLIQAKIEAGLFTPRPERVDVSVVTRDVVTAMRPLCAQRQQRISLDTPQVMPRIQGDPQLLTQALTNLLSNASRFTTAGGSIDVRVAVIDTGVAVYVTDDGAGMTPDERHRLFRRFATGRPLADGTGLGLVITKTIVELHGGDIMVHTASARGTTFLLTLPRGESR
ncbi:sensor histidine kinase [Phytohabitans rumicis]|uniref:sensor histidine kinase n=1 Tax=Phytohabitans rumicis TaxID=1076125 RepID=UPI001563E782|nr:HAMP domain-containing sensor histidine kinase [Phytohabitans rumicis]